MFALDGLNATTLRFGFARFKVNFEFQCRSVQFYGSAQLFRSKKRFCSFWVHCKCKVHVGLVLVLCLSNGAPTGTAPFAQFAHTTQCACPLTPIPTNLFSTLQSVSAGLADPPFTLFGVGAVFLDKTLQHHSILWHCLFCRCDSARSCRSASVGIAYRQSGAVRLIQGSLSVVTRCTWLDCEA